MKDYALKQDHLDALRLALVRRERSSATVEKYVRDAGQFLAWLGGRAVTPEAVSGWKNALLAAGRCPATVQGKLADLNALFACLGWEDSERLIYEIADMAK